MNNYYDSLLELSNQRLLPQDHLNYLKKLRESGKSPKVIYDIGACVLHWTREARLVWPEAEFYAFEAMPESADIFKTFNVPYYIGVLSSSNGKELEFYQNTQYPGGNSYYPEHNTPNNVFYNEQLKKKKVVSITLDAAVGISNFPYPDLIKMDVQGAELDILRGASRCLQTCEDLILELQVVEYNQGAPLKDDVISYLYSIGFQLKTALFSNNGPDGDYHFVKAK